MTTANPQPTKRPPRWRFQFTLAWLLGLVVVANLYFAYFLYEPAKWDRVEIHVRADMVVVDNETAWWDDLAALLEQRVERIRESGTDPEAATVRITVDDEAVYADFRRAVEACQDAGLYRIHIRPDRGTDWFHVIPQPKGYGDGMPSYTIGLQASGTVDAIECDFPHGTAVITTGGLSQLRHQLIEFGRADEEPILQIKCHDHLEFKHVAVVLRAMTETRTGSRLRVPLIRNFVIRAGGLEPLTSDTSDLFLGPDEPTPPIDVIPPFRSSK